MPCRPTTSIMVSKTRERLLALVVWVIVWQLAAMTLGHGGLFLATPLQTLQALGLLLPHPGILAAHRLQRAAHRRRLCAGGRGRSGAGGGGGPLAHRAGAGGPRHAADPCYAGGQLCHSGTALGQAAAICRWWSALPMCCRWSTPVWWPASPTLTLSFSRWPGCTACPGRRGCAISGCRASSVLLRKLHRRHGHVLEKRCLGGGHRPARPLGGGCLYRAKITLSTPDVFAWTLVIVLLSALLSAVAARLLRAVKRRLCGEVTA